MSGTPSASRTPGVGELLPGLLLCVLITVAAVVIGELPFKPFTVAGKHPIEPVMIAIVLGMLISNLFELPKSLTPGIKFATKKLLPLGIIFVGARLDFREIAKVGATGLLLSIATIVVALGLFLLFIKFRWLETKLGLLLGIGTAICGGTAIVAAAPVINADDDDVAFGVATVTLLGLVGMFVMPVLGQLMHLSEQNFGIWAGLSIHQTPQVVAAGFAYGPIAGIDATTVKLSRVCLLAPAIFVVGLIAARADRSARASDEPVNYLKMFPLFVFGFLAMALLRTLGFLADVTIDGYVIRTAVWCEAISKYLIIASMAGVGLETRFAALKQTGLKPMMLGAVTSVFISVGILTVLLLLPHR